MFVTSLVYAVLNWRVLDMASAGASCTVTVEDQRSYIKIETLRGKNPTEIHSALREVCGEHTVDRSTVSRWATRFLEGRVTIKDDPRPGRPKTSTDELSVKTRGGLSCARSWSDVRRNVTSYRDFTNISIPYFDK